MRLASLSIDLDGLSLYARIHGLPAESVPPEADRLVYELAIERLLELCDAVGLRATFFAVGQSLREPAAAKWLKRAASEGHEVASHSDTHDYALTRKSDAEIDGELERAERAIEAVCGRKPVGFRAPGYTLTATLVQLLARRGYLYDASVFPSAPYWLAKAAVMGFLSVLGRPSQAILDRPKVLSAPRTPYRPSLDEPYRIGAAPLLELPVGVESATRVPFIGTAVLAMPEVLSRTLYQRMASLPFLGFQLHGIDLLDAEDVKLPALARRQRDLGVPWATKKGRLTRVLRWMVRDYEVLTLEQAARRFGAGPRR